MKKTRTMITKSRARAKILLVDDELDVTFSLKLLLKDNGFKVEAYNDPTSALAHFKPGLYDLIILDVKMPQLDGFELYKKIRELDHNVKVLFLTALSDFSDYKEAFDKASSTLAKNWFIRKPVGSQELLRRISI
jgi:two-component system, OmpR family, response regulator ChvI